jgi:hypothetical protein
MVRPITGHGRTMIPLTRRAGGLQASTHHMPPDRTSQTPEPRTHEGYEWLYVLNDRLRLVLAEHELVLAPEMRLNSTPGCRTRSATPGPKR